MNSTTSTPFRRCIGSISALWAAALPGVVGRICAGRRILARVIAIGAVAGSLPVIAADDPRYAELYPSPARFVTQTFAEHDVVFLSEYHMIAQNLTFLASLLPDLYKAGVYNLGWEFAHQKDQALIDKLLSGPIYDEALSATIMLSWRHPGRLVWGYKEYEDVFRAAWRLNKALPGGVRKFRIVALNTPVVWQSWEYPGDSRETQYWLSWIDQNVFWANVIMTEIVGKGEKALIFCGNGHTTTRFYQDRGASKSITAGNIVYHSIGKRAYRVLLHGSAEGLLARGSLRRIEDAIAQLPRSGAAFGTHLKDSPLGKLDIETKGYVDGKSSGFTLSDYADGYVYLAPVVDWKPLTVIPGFINERNRWVVQMSMLGYRPGEAEKSVAELNALMERRAGKVIDDLLQRYRADSP